MVKNKPVGLSFINKGVKEVNTKEKYYLDVEKGEFITYSPIFSIKKIDELLIELVETIKYCKEKNIDYLKHDAEIYQYTNFLIIKHFTSLANELKNKPVEVHIETLSKMYEMGLYNLLLEDMFDEIEIKKVLDKLKDLTKMSTIYKQALDEQKKIVSENVQSEPLRNRILNN